ncbi:LysR family transcriptional regulator [Corynebacterium sp. S7]
MKSAEFSIESLRYANAAEVEGSFSAAARIHGIAQPALSTSVANLEKQLGCPIFSRSPKGVVLTEFGEKIFPLIRKALESFDDISEASLHHSNPFNRSIRVGTTSLISPNLLEPIKQYIHSVTPDQEIVLKEAELRTLREDLTMGELDLLVIPAVGPMKGFEHRIIDSEPIAVVGAPGTSGSVIEIKELAQRAVVFPPPHSALAKFTHDLFEVNGVSVSIYPGEATSCSTLENWATMGFGCAILPLSQISANCPTVRPLYEDGHEVEIFYEAVWSESSLFAEVTSSAVSKVASSEAICRA